MAASSRRRLVRRLRAAIDLSMPVVCIAGLVQRHRAAKAGAALHDDYGKAIAMQCSRCQFVQMQITMKQTGLAKAELA